ncbi:hypothetical protein [Actinomadura sp. NBRC 104425]|uniref:hypothetical protein n=1 Tax=Actinomadura sp. NBRC 104425 TaxID=3032204 RepID=UPI0025560BB4|nr:hypothetical protein [Actinomadura sp. NBRC 104425]
MGIKISEIHDASEVSESCTDHKTSEYMADAAVLLKTQDGPWGVVVEVQRNDRLHDKQYTWPLYLATLRARHECPATLLVIAPQPAVARACAATIETGHPGYDLTPLVLRPEHVPVMTDPDAIAAEPAMGVLSAMFHAGPDDTLDAIVHAHDKIAEKDRAVARRYHDWVSALIPEAVRKSLEEKMKTESRWYSETAQAWIAEGKAQGIAEGEAVGEAKSVLLILEARGITVTDEQRQRVLTCTDLQQLETWVRRAATISSADELFN